MTHTSQQFLALKNTIHFAISQFDTVPLRAKFTKLVRDVKEHYEWKPVSKEEQFKSFDRILNMVIFELPAHKREGVYNYLRNRMMTYQLEAEAPLTQEETTVNYQQSNLLLSDNPNFRIVEIQFDKYTDRNYYYKTFDASLQAEQRIIVDAPSTGLTAVTIISVMTYDEYVERMGDRKALKWVVGTIDTTKYEQCKELEAKMTKVITDGERRKARAAVMDELTLSLTDDAKHELVRLSHEAATFGVSETNQGE